MLQLAHNDVQAALARIEAALVQSLGLLRCIEQETTTTAWHSQIEEKRDMLQKAALDTVTLRRHCDDDDVWTGQKDDMHFEPSCRATDGLFLGGRYNH